MALYFERENTKIYDLHYIWDNCGTVCRNLTEKVLRLRNEQRTLDDSQHMSFVIFKCPMSVPQRGKVMLKIHEKWRMGWDSNPRNALTFAGFQDRCLQPLDHPSTCSSSTEMSFRRQASSQCRQKFVNNISKIHLFVIFLRRHNILLIINVNKL